MEAPIKLSIPQIVSMVKADPSVDVDKKTELLHYIATPMFEEKLKSGVIGGGLAYLLGNFMKLGTTSKLLLMAAGYGIARLIDKIMVADDKYMEYNPKTKTYRIK